MMTVINHSAAYKVCFDLALPELEQHYAHNRELIVVHFSAFNDKVRWTTRKRDVRTQHGKMVIDEQCIPFLVTVSQIDSIRRQLNNGCKDILIAGFRYYGDYTGRPGKAGWIDSVERFSVDEISSIEFPLKGM